ncbi:MAG: hypothetical protein HW421_1580 [Ignavibacteria bacterium]|nr:hypothetical protein [Ignavibacteria bacterium]
MSSFQGGWNTLSSAAPKPITDLVTFSSVYTNAVTIQGVVKNVTTFNTPTGGTWFASPITISSKPLVEAVAASTNPTKVIIADALNMQTKTWNSSAPLPLLNLVFLFGNDSLEALDYIMNIPLNFGGHQFNLCQVGILENAATAGNEQGLIQVIDFAPPGGNFTGAVNLRLLISGFNGPINLGIRLEDTNTESSLFELKAAILPVNLS